MTTTQLLDLVEQLTLAQIKTELRQIKQRYGDEAVQEAWEYLSDAEKARIHAIANQEGKN